MRTLIASAVILATLASANSFASESNKNGAAIEITISSSHSNRATLLIPEVGEPVSYFSGQERTSTCHFKSGQQESTFEIDASPGVTGIVLPLEITSAGVKTIISLANRSVKNPDMIQVSADCDVAVGSISTVSTTNIYTLPWNNPIQLKLPDGSVFDITATNQRSNAGIGFEKPSTRLATRHELGR